MGFLFGLVIAVRSLFAAALHLNQEAKHFWDFVAFACVMGGTVAVAVMTIPWQYRRLVGAAALSLFRGSSKEDGAIVVESIDFMRAMQNGTVDFAPSTSVAGEILRDGMELVSLGFTKEKIHTILEERILQSFERSQKVANSIRALAKYPPAFGLAGTVLGLVTLMRKVSEGADAKQTGILMAIALMATFYGLLVSNLLINPAGEFLVKNALADRKKAEIALHSILLYLEGASLLEAQEVLNCYVTKESRVNVVAVDSTAEAA